MVTRRLQKVARHLTVGQNANMSTSAEATSKMAKSAAQALREKLDNSLLKELDSDPEEDANFPNRATRIVKSGHFVRIVPTPLKEPHLISFSEDMAERLGLSESQVKDESFLRLFSADNFQVDPELRFESWCTPYAVSVHGMPILDPCGQNGYAYGDGRACSIGEFLGTDNKRWEVQLKGCGPTPFARSFDGRAVLRSSIREFLVSEAMYALGVPTTRAISLIGSKEDIVARAWYQPDVISDRYDFPPNVMIEEPCAISCRCASSFLRVGQVELYQRRMQNGDPGAKESFVKFIRHCLQREFPSIEIPDLDDKSGLHRSIIAMLQEFAKRQAHLVQEWIRVGYTQGNMNSDNCLLSGLTMDYGPFGFIERYSPLWTPFTSDPDRKFGFERQPVAAHVNLASLTEAVLPLLDDDQTMIEAATKVVKEDFPTYMLAERNEMRRRKLGLRKWKQEYDKEIWEPLYRLLIDMDYTLFWRELIKFKPDQFDGDDVVNAVNFLQKAVYGCFSGEKRALLHDWLKRYLKALNEDGISNDERVELMCRSNPKYIPREWMLVQAYEAAACGDYRDITVLKSLFQAPYLEQPEMESKFYRQTPIEFQRKAGVAFFSCSS